jgi:hypothetical protein
MPLPSVLIHGALQCHAKCKATQNPCRNPAAYGMRVCRYHGARRPGTILKGKDHPNYRHGQETLEAKVERTEGVARLQGLEALGRAIGLIVGPKTRGPKVKLV